MATEETYPNSPTADADPAAELREQEFVADPTSPPLILSEPEQGSTTAKVASAGIVQSVGKLVGYASGILTLALTARLLTASDFGGLHHHRRRLSHSSSPSSPILASLPSPCAKAHGS